jgi:fumarylacetoacetate (FAA) hydrolase family protein
MNDRLLDDEEAERIAEELAAKYGSDALDYVRSRAERAQSVGDELAFGAWQRVLDAAESRLCRKGPALTSGGAA